MNTTLKSARPWLALVMSAMSAAVLAQSGLKTPDSTAWPRWQARVGLSTAAPLGAEAAANGSQRVAEAQVFGDYYFTGPGFGQGRVSGGLRATSGLVFGPRSATLGTTALAQTRGNGLSMTVLRSQIDSGADTSSTIPYVGLGYTGLVTRTGLSFTADVGVMARGPGSGIRLGRSVQGQLVLEDYLRELRLAPVLQLGVSYSF